MAQRDKDRNLEMAARKLSQTKLSKKEKQKQKEAKKLSKTQKVDADKVSFLLQEMIKKNIERFLLIVDFMLPFSQDADESQLPLSAVTVSEKNKTKKKRKLFPF